MHDHVPQHSHEVFLQPRYTATSIEKAEGAGGEGRSLLRYTIGGTLT